jgi:hypothetical protein
MARVWPAGCGEKGFTPAPGASPFDVAALHGGIDAIRTAVKDAEKASAELQGVPADATAAARAEAYARISARVVAGARGLIAIFPEPTAGRPELARVLDHVERACRDLAGGRYARVALEVAGVSAYIAAKELMPQAQFLRVTSFAADVAQAGTAEQAAAAIERFAAPPGGYLRKRRGGRWYGTVNGYVGGSGAWELAKQASGGWSGARWGFAPGFWVPVGIEGGIAFKGTSLGLLAYPIDLGVLASWRVKNDDLEARPVVGTEQVFAPGGAIVWGIPRAPITVAASVSLAPRLRVVEEPGQADRERNALRVGLNLAVDIPIFP